MKKTLQTNITVNYSYDTRLRQTHTFATMLVTR